MAGDTSHIVQSLFTNLGIAAAKGVGAAYTGSGAMLAETIHSAADCGNQLLLLLGVKKAHQPASPSHPLGYGRSLYFWSFMVALLLFTGGGVFSIYEGVHKIMHPEPVENVILALGILGFSIALEGWATFSNMRELNKRRAGVPFFRYLRETKDSDLIVVFGENSAATLGLAVALLALVAAELTGDARFDAVGSLVIGAVLIAVAVFLAVEVKSLLVGEAADPTIAKAAAELISRDENMMALLNAITVQQGPGQVMVALKIQFKPGLDTDRLVGAINGFERALKQRCPEVRWSFVEPDVPK